MRYMMGKSCIALALVALVLGGCVNLDLGGGKNASALTYYVLNDHGRASPLPSNVSPNPQTLLVLDMQAAGFYDTDGLAYSEHKGTRDYYQYARWAERPGRRLTELIKLRLDRERRFKAVVGDGQVSADWLLETRLLECYHDAANPPGAAVIVLSADVVDLTTHNLIAHRLFRVSGQIDSFDAAGAHAGFDRATTQLLDELSDWLAAQPST
jgi:cholesterol transport system auxiliary component